MDDEGSIFNDEWGIKYFFVQSKTGEKAICVICTETIAVRKEYNIRRHYDTKHAEIFSQFKEKERLNNLNHYLKLYNPNRNFL